MRSRRVVSQRAGEALALCFLFAPVHDAVAQASSAVLLRPGQALVLGVSPAGEVEISLDQGKRWSLCASNQLLEAGDFLRTREHGRALLRLSDMSFVRVGPLSVCQVRDPSDIQTSVWVHLLKGVVYFFSREKPAKVRFGSPTTLVAVRGTEFNLEVVESGSTIFTMLEGEAELSGASQTLRLGSGMQARVEPGEGPRAVPGEVVAVNVIQWCLYYPAVLDADELDLTPEENQALAASLTAYRSGDLLAALTNYPAGRPAISAAERIYRAALSLAVGQVDQAEASLRALPGANLAGPQTTLAAALRKVVAAVKGQQDLTPANPESATSLLAESYYRQSRSTLDQDRDALDQARHAARLAAGRSLRFGSAWTRWAELEFSFGRTRRALAYADRGLALAPDHAQAIALKGYLLAAEGRMAEALSAFDRAIAKDGALGNAWLGRGLCKIRRGHVLEGRDDLQAAVALEPQRALFRSYLGKAFSEAKDDARALRELDLAKVLDPHDPTPWLYASFVHREKYQINQAVNDLEQSMTLNDNRALYRSGLLLDQDRAVRSSSLASIYQSAGLSDVSVREAARAVSYDYGNYSAHLFLSDSYNALREPTRFNLRYETVWFNEWLLANLLSPVGGTPLSPHLAEQEYSRLFERNRLGLSSDTTYRSDGNRVYALASQYGVLGHTAWSLDLDYAHQDGVRPNNDLDRLEWYTTIKQQLSLKDSVMLLAKYQDYHSGDNFQYYDPANASRTFRFDEDQSPILLGGYHREWTPGMHTMLLGGRLESNHQFADLATPQLILIRYMQTDPPFLAPLTTYDYMDVDHHIELEIYTAEAQQILENERHALVVGARWQGGTFNTESWMTNPAIWRDYVPMPPGETHTVEDFKRVSAYGYETLKLPGRLRVTGGLTYDYLLYPINFRSPPIQAGEQSRERLNPKAALVWDPWPQATLRGLYAQSLGGVSLDESYRLEPTQLAGFGQAFRTLISESLVGSVAAPDHEVYGAALDLKFKTRTYLGFHAEMLRSGVEQTLGVFAKLLNGPEEGIFPDSIQQLMDYEERTAGVSLNQLLSDEWVLGAKYAFVRSELDLSYPDLVELFHPPDTTIRADLHRAGLFLRYSHPSGWFAGAEFEWYFQDRSVALISFSRPPEEVPHESLPQLNLFVGYRFPRQHGDLTLGLLNATGEDYRLNPVTPYAELPREPAFQARLRFRF